MSRSASSPVLAVLAVRPNYMKMAPVVHEMRRRAMPHLLVRAGQHFDANMSRVFLEELGLPEPDIDLACGPGTHAQQTAKVMVAFERALMETNPSLVIVAGDANSTLACALSAAKLGIPVAHVEAGLRSFDRSMPEEINRMLTDKLSDLLFATERAAVENLRKEGLAPNRIHLVGNTMIDSLRAQLGTARARQPWKRLGLAPKSYGVVTLHRPGNVDVPSRTRAILDALLDVASSLPLVFPVHPRTRERISVTRTRHGLRVVEPLGYLDFLGLVSEARVVLTDSGGVQDETTALSVPCLTLRDSTERPVTVEEGTNRVIGTDAERIRAELDAVLSSRSKSGAIPELWDGKAGVRVVDAIEQWVEQDQARCAEGIEVP